MTKEKLLSLKTFSEFLDAIKANPKLLDEGTSMYGNKLWLNGNPEDLDPDIMVDPNPRNPSIRENNYFNSNVFRDLANLL